jgi:anthranilate phosphoribosyltransferase
MIKEAITALVERRELARLEAEAVMGEIMRGEATPAQVAAFVTALRLKGETVDEIAGLAAALRAHARVITSSEDLLDTCGTGGDGAATFNISTAAAFVAAGAGVKVAKHGNRAASSRCGSADVLEALGMRLDLTPEEAARCLRETGMVFLFAPAFHPALKHAAVPRREIGIRTVFNLLGPLANPAGARRQLLGVADGALVRRLAEVLLRLGAERALVVHGEDGLDELTVTGPSRVCELRGGALLEYSVTPESLGLKRADPASLAGGDAAANAQILKRVLGGEPGPRREVVVLNAAAALVAAGRTDGLASGLELARESLDSGRAAGALEKLVRFCRGAVAS